MTRMAGHVTSSFDCCNPKLLNCQSMSQHMPTVLDLLYQPGVCRSSVKTSPNQQTCGQPGGVRHAKPVATMHM